MIPHVIHYCWFGHNPKPRLAEKCIASWKKHCPDFKILEWNENNFDIKSAPPYVQQAYIAKKWAFVADYARLKIIHEYGGIYLDTDVELLTNFDKLLIHQGFFGFEGTDYINTGLGFGAVASLPLVKELMDDYEKIPFRMKDGSYDMTPCPVRNTPVFLKKGLKCDGTMQLLDGDILVLPAEYLCPIDNATRTLTKTKNTISIHHFDASWQTLEDRKAHNRLAQARRNQIKKDRMLCFLSKHIRSLLGEIMYNKLKQYVKHWWQNE